MASILATNILRMLGDNVRKARVVPTPYMMQGRMWVGNLKSSRASGFGLMLDRGGYVVVCNPLEQPKAYAALEAAQRLWAERAPN